MSQLPPRQRPGRRPSSVVRRLLFTMILCLPLPWCHGPATVQAAESTGYLWTRPSENTWCLTLYAKAAADGSLTEFAVPDSNKAGHLMRGEIHWGPYTGAHDGANSATRLQDLSSHWEEGELEIVTGGLTLTNSTDSSSGSVTANSHTVVWAALSGGTDNDWDAGDSYSVGCTAAPTTSTTDILIKNWLGVEIFGDTTLDNLTTSADCDVEPDIAYRYTTGPLTVDMTGNSVNGGGFCMKLYFLEK